VVWDEGGVELGHGGLCGCVYVCVCVLGGVSGGGRKGEGWGLNMHT
jgi:hypothetical protein